MARLVKYFVRNSRGHEIEIDQSMVYPDEKPNLDNAQRWLGHHARNGELQSGKGWRVEVDIYDD